MQNNEMQEQKFKKGMVLSKMPFDECSAAMGSQVGFKSVGFFAVIKSNGVLDSPRFIFWCMRHIAFVMFFKAGFQIFGTADIEMGSGCFIHEYVNIIEVGHRVFYWRLALSVMLAEARLHLLYRLRRGSLPRWVRSSAPVACRGEISALPRWRLVGDEGKPEIFQLRLKLAVTPWFYAEKWLWRLNLPFNKNHL